MTYTGINERRWPSLFIPHGGGPCFFMPDPRGIWTRMADYLQGIAGALGGSPKAIVVVSGHWSEDVPTVHTGARPSLLFDYYGFPENTYSLTWPAPGSPELADVICTLLANAGIAFSTEGARGWDHGVFVPFKLIWPDADIPTVEISLRVDEDPSAHLALGRALRPLRDQGVLIVGSGMSYHNLRETFGPRGVADSEAFDEWLCQTTAASPEERARRLIDWRAAPGAIACHPQGDHLIPLHVVAGAAGDDIGRQTYSDRLLGKAISAFQFG